MRALSIRQPFADQVLQLRGGKDVENRTWRVDPQRIVVHAGKQMWDGPEAEGEGWRTRSAFLGFVTITGCHRAFSTECALAGCHESRWAIMQAFYAPPGPRSYGARRLYHWTLDHPRKFVNPIPAAGRIGLWTPSIEQQQQIEAAAIADALAL